MLDKQTHEKYMKDILKVLFSSEISEKIAFKWWTLLYFLYWLDRFSIDIDLDLLDIEYESKVTDKIEYFLLSLWDIKSFLKWNTLHRWIFSYDEFAPNIKIELNKRIWKNNEYERVDFLWNSMNVMQKSSIFANKLVACYERTENRDLYDIYFFLQNNYNFNGKIISERTGLSSQDFLKNLIDSIPKRYNKSHILHKLWEVVNQKQKYWIKENLINQVVEDLKKLV